MTLDRAVFPIIAGPTASGKTGFALELASRHGLEIINADSLLVYRGFDIGTAKPAAQDLARVPHHLIDICEPTQNFTAADFVKQVHSLTETLSRRNRGALIVGGTHFYLKALCMGLWDAPATQPDFRASLEHRATAELFQELSAKDPPHAAKIGSSDRYRIVRALEILQFSGNRPSELQAQAESRAPDPRFQLLWIDREDAELESRIADRTHQMLEHGLIEETQKLLLAHPGARALDSVGYRQVVSHLRGETPPGRKVRPGLDGLSDEIRLATRQLVKAQRTFLRGFEFAERFLFEADRPRLEARIQNLLA